eukprot:SAG31_NODE_5098_length_2745_cov_1.886999_1_plen_142_part_00
MHHTTVSRYIVYIDRARARRRRAVHARGVGRTEDGDCACATTESKLRACCTSLPKSQGGGCMVPGAMRWIAPGLLASVSLASTETLGVQLTKYFAPGNDAQQETASMSARSVRNNRTQQPVHQPFNGKDLYFLDCLWDFSC